ncbi:hypothetical protein ZOSMA_10G00790 [Zostera marina]|uniref:Uncharacterized protein n=1 Tax=Zostera marina TaxID=29655 RepID=A0A0K9Q3G5_ZOSMR|nr:hypothetical protein ZOSMA_10G00790 [Zostera marina]
MRDFQLLDILYSEPTTSAAIDLNLDYVSLMKSIVIPTSDYMKDLNYCQEHISDTAITIIDHSKSVSVSKSNFEIRPTSLPSISDPMSIDLPLGIPLNNLNPSTCNEDLVTSVGCIVLLVVGILPRGYVVPEKLLVHTLELVQYEEALEADDALCHGLDLDEYLVEQATVLRNAPTESVG